MILDLSQSNLTAIFEITEDGHVLLKQLTHRAGAAVYEKKPKWCPIAEVHVCGENQDDHHGGKHTGTSGGLSLRYVSHRIEEGTTARGTPCKTLIFTLADRSMSVDVHYAFHSDIAAVRTWASVTNTADAPLGLEYVSSFAITGFDLDGTEVRPNEKLRVSIPHNGWLRECKWREYSLSDLGLEHTSSFSTKPIRVSNCGTWSSKEYLPMGAVHNMQNGDTMLWQIEHNGSWSWELGDIGNMMYLKLGGPCDQEHGWYKELQPGETFESVRACVALGESFDAALAQMTAYRRTLFVPHPVDGALPVIFNDYMNCLMADPNEQKVLAYLDRAAQAGAEIYCMDAGWYADERGWWSLVGEWIPDSGRFPHGIRYVFDRIRERGLIPGIWLEPEVMGIDCPLAKEFPDECFFMRHGKRVIDHGRYHLDLRHPRVRAHLNAVIDRLVEEYGTGYIKLDYNIDGGIGTEVDADSFGDGLLEHNRAYLSWLSSVRERHPALILENCASGGMRMDYAQLSVAQLQSVSDQTDYRLMASLSAAAPTAVLPEQSAIWAYPLANADENAVVFNMVNALLGRVHLSGKLLDLPEDRFALIREGIEVYKRIRGDIASATPHYPLGLPVYRDSFLCVALTAPQSTRLAVWRMDTDADSVHIPMAGDTNHAHILYPAGTAAKISPDGDGITVTLPDRYTAVVIEL